MKIVADENILYAREAFACLGEVTTLPGREIKLSDLNDCDCLLVRSVTRVNGELLEGSAVKFVASATIGTDHVDLDYLKARNIGFANAPGCNAESASEYIVNALFYLANMKGFDPFKLTAGIVGHGNVGSRVKHKLDILGVKTLVNDPPRKAAGDRSVQYTLLDNLIEQCDFITLHVPLTENTAYPTRHLFDQSRLTRLRSGCVLFNAARGAVVDNQALLELLKQRSDLTVFLDTWEGEPEINPQLLQQVDLATPHIAGYSREGKLRGTQMIVDAATNYFGVSSNWSMARYLPEIQELDPVAADQPLVQVWHELLSRHYNIAQDHQALLATAGLKACERAIAFDRLRKRYPERYEYDRFRGRVKGDEKIALQIGKLGFSTDATRME